MTKHEPDQFIEPTWGFDHCFWPDTETERFVIDLCLLPILRPPGELSQHLSLLWVFIGYYFLYDFSLSPCIFISVGIIWSWLMFYECNIPIYGMYIWIYIVKCWLPVYLNHDFIQVPCLKFFNDFPLFLSITYLVQQTRPSLSFSRILFPICPRCALRSCSNSHLHDGIC